MIRDIQGRRVLLGAAVATATLAAARAAAALDLSSLSQGDATAGVRAALEKGAAVAVDKLGIENGFLGNPKVKIPLPDGLRQAEKVMKMMGRQQQFDDLVVSINRAAETAVPQARPLLLAAIKSMSVSDAKGILAGGEDSVTRFFRDKTETSLTAKFLPTVKQVTDKVGLAQRYNSLAGQAASLGAIKSDNAKIENYVTNRTLAGLFTMIADEERAIRRDPVGTGSAILKKVFGR
ncbi:MAG: DUF4197 domain-containing protein [Lautropia sp.]